jgi:site-specific recombinase XerD
MSIINSAFQEGDMNQLLNQPGSELSTIVEKAREYIGDARSENTKRAYRADWQDFAKWCNSNSYCELPAEPGIVCLYLTQLSDSKKVSTLQRRLAAIGQAHLAAGYSSPTGNISVRSLMRGIRRKVGSIQVGKAPLLTEHIRRMVSLLPATKAGVRDRALILLGFSGAFRRSELISLNLGDIEFTKEGLVLALQEWLENSCITSGAIFRGIDRHSNISEKQLTGKAVSLIIKRIAKKAGLDPDKFAGHSLRAGLATQASISGATEIEIMNQTGHRSLTTLRRYIRDGNLFRQNAAGKIGL